MKEFKGPDPKVKQRGPHKAARTVDKKATRRATLKHRSCGICGDPATNGHHVIAKGAPHFGDDVPGNIVPLCGTGTSGCHGDVEAERTPARRALGAHIKQARPDVIAYVREKLGDGPGDDWLRRRLYIKPGR